VNKIYFNYTVPNTISSQYLHTILSHSHINSHTTVRNSRLHKTQLSLTYTKYQLSDSYTIAQLVSNELRHYRLINRSNGDLILKYSKKYTALVLCSRNYYN